MRNTKLKWVNISNNKFINIFSGTAGRTNIKRMASDTFRVWFKSFLSINEIERFEFA